MCPRTMPADRVKTDDGEDERGIMPVAVFYERCLAIQSPLQRRPGESSFIAGSGLHL
jgi:hypothetical protein